MAESSRTFAVLRKLVVEAKEVEDRLANTRRRIERLLNEGTGNREGLQSERGRLLTAMREAKDVISNTQKIFEDGPDEDFTAPEEEPDALRN